MASFFKPSSARFPRSVDKALRSVSSRQSTYSHRSLRRIRRAERWARRQAAAQPADSAAEGDYAAMAAMLSLCHLLGRDGDRAPRLTA